MAPKKYDSTVARIAGNVASGLIGHLTLKSPDKDLLEIPAVAVAIARAIVAEVERTEPEVKP